MKNIFQKILTQYLKINMNNYLSAKSNDLRKKTLLVVNTGPKRKEFVMRAIKSIGTRIVVLNNEKNWADKYVDEWIIADTINHKQAVRAVQNYINNSKIKIDGAVTYWECGVLLTAKIIDKFGFIGNSYISARIARDKYLFRDFCEAHDIPTPKFKMVKSRIDIEKIKREFNFPVVVKPKFGSNSAAVRKVDLAEGLAATYQKVKNLVLFDSTRHQFDPDIIVEEYIDGQEVDIDLLVQAGEIKFSAISDNAMIEPYFIEVGRETPSRLAADKQKELLAMTNKLIKKMGIKDSCVHFEARIGKQGAVPIEINLRLGGDEAAPSIQEAWGTDLIQGFARIALGEKIENRPKALRQYIMSYDFLNQKNGILKQIIINPKAKTEEFIKGYQFFKAVGAEVKSPEESCEYLGWVMVSGDSREMAARNLAIAKDYFKYEIKPKTSDKTGRILNVLSKNYFEILKGKRLNFLKLAK